MCDPLPPAPVPTHYLWSGAPTAGSGQLRAGRWTTLTGVQAGPLYWCQLQQFGAETTLVGKAKDLGGGGDPAWSAAEPVLGGASGLLLACVGENPRSAGLGPASQLSPIFPGDWGPPSTA